MKIEYLADHPDWVSLIAFLHQWEMREPQERDFASSIQRFSQRMYRDELPLTLVAVEDTIPVGSISLLDSQLSLYPEHSLWLASLFVMKPYQRRGIAEQLMLRVEHIAVSMGHRHLYLFTHTAEEYYKNRGWKTIDMVAPPDVSHASVVMSKQLEG